MAARWSAAWFMLLGLLAGGCASVPSTPEEALTELIEDAVRGRTPDGQYQNVTPTDEAAAAQFVYVEEWLDVNGESVVGVRPMDPPAEGAFRYTRSADGRITYLISYGWPGPHVRSRALRPAPGSVITMLGWPDILPWAQLGDVLVVETPREMADEENHPCKQAFVFKVEAPR
jgi:hypothetical protein